MLLLFDVVPEAIPEHDAWHTHEHLPERLRIPGFIRGTRWVAPDARPRYFVLYEVEQLSTLTSAPYLERLNNPTPWTAKMMPGYRGMARGFCVVTGSFGSGMGRAALLMRFDPPTQARSSARDWLLGDVLPRLPARPGIGSAHLLEGASTPPMTNEQRIRGADSGIEWALLVTGYDRHVVANLARADLAPGQFERHGVPAVVAAGYRMDYSITEREAAA